MACNAYDDPPQVDEYYSAEESRSLTENVSIRIRLVMLVLILIIIPACINLGFAFRILPELEIISFSIFNLNISTSKLVVVWDANIRFQNFKMNSAATEVVHHDRVEGYIFYQNMDNQLVAPKGKAFSERENEKEIVCMKFAKKVLEADQPVVEDNVISEISKELEKGLIHFSLRIDLQVSFEKWGIRWSGNHVKYAMDWYCWDLIVGIDLSTGKGKLVSAGGILP